MFYGNTWRQSRKIDTTQRVQMNTQMALSYATSHYLIYICHTSKSSVSESIIGGSLLIDHAQTKEEAVAKVAMYKARGDEFAAKFPSSDTRRYVYIDNKREWWERVASVAPVAPVAALAI